MFVHNIKRPYDKDTIVMKEGHRLEGQQYYYEIQTVLCMLVPTPCLLKVL